MITEVINKISLNDLLHSTMSAMFSSKKAIQVKTNAELLAELKHREEDADDTIHNEMECLCIEEYLLSNGDEFGTDGTIDDCLCMMIVYLNDIASRNAPTFDKLFNAAFEITKDQFYKPDCAVRILKNLEYAYNSPYIKR